MTAHISDSFFEVPTHNVHTSAGDISLPVFYYDVSTLTALFYCQRHKAEVMLQGTGLEPAFSAGPWALAAVSMYEYRRTSAGAYNEVGLALPVVRHGQGQLLRSVYDVVAEASRREMGFYLLDLPVTTELADAAGRELWGYPKFVTQIPFEMKGRQFRSQVFQPGSGQVIMTLRGKMGLGVTVPPLSLMTYSYRDKQLVRTLIDVRGKTTLSLPGSLQLLAGSSGHPMAERLRQLGLHNSKPLLVMSTHKFQSRLNPGEVI